MADEGSQTVALDARDTLENAQTSVLGNGHPQHGSDLPEIRTTDFVPPATHIHIGLNTTYETQQIYVLEETPIQAPRSPRLQPIPSDILPQVSPLITSKPNPFTQNGDSIKDTTPTLGGQSTNSLAQELPTRVEDGQGELFPSSHMEHVGEQQVSEFPAFQDQTTGMNEINRRSFESQLLPNGQFGQWQSPNAHPDLSEPDKEGLHNESLYVDGIGRGSHRRQQFEDEYPGNEFPISQSQISSYHPYPALGTELRSQPVDNPWQLNSGSVPYPELPEHEDENRQAENNLLPSSPSSVSGLKDKQSDVVDLTESDDDAEEQDSSKRSIDNRATEGSMEAEEDEEREEEEAIDDQISERDSGLRHRYYSNDEERMQDEGVSEEYSEEYREEDFSDADGEEEIYDEDEMEVDEPQHRPLVPNEPVVIDLLSSDEEDNEEMPISTPPASISVHRGPETEQESESGEEEDEEESASEMDDKEGVDHDKDVPYSQRSEISTNIADDESSEPSGKDEDALGAIEGDGRVIEEDGDIDEEFDGAREEEGLQPEYKDDTLPAQVNDASNKQTTGPHHIGELSSPPAQGQTTHDVASDAKSHVKKPAPTTKPSLLARMFNLDGANDEAAAISSFPILAKKVATPNSAPDSKTNAQVAATDPAHSLVQGGVQLLTPDATQVSLIKDSQESSLLPSQTDVTDTPEAVKISLPRDKILREKTESALPEGNNIRIEVHGAENEEVEPVEIKPTIEEAIDEQPTEHRPDSLNDVSEAMAEHHVDSGKKVTRISPRRSRRIASGSAAQIAEIMRSSTPDNSRSPAKHDDQQKSPASPDSQSKQGHNDQSIEMTMAEPKSSPRTQHDLRSTSVVDLKLSLSRALRTDLSEFTALKVLRYHLNQKLDVMAIVTSTPAEPQRSKGGPRQYQIAFNITDSSIAPSGVTEVQVFRPYKEALPIVKEGDGILLRNFQVIAIKNKGFALRSENSEACSWAVFKDGVAKPEVRGPPVEYGEAEQNHMDAMKKWYGSLDAGSVAKLNRANTDKSSGVGKGIGKAH